MKEWVAVLGGAYHYDRAQLEAAYCCGRELARLGYGVLTGATTGIPYAASLGAGDAGGVVVGISPALSAAEHLERYRKPLSSSDLVIFSGQSVDGRASLILRSAAAAIFIGGEMGTLAEFAAGWLCGCPLLGLLESAGGITADLRRIASQMVTQWGSALVCADDPTALVRRLSEAMQDVGRPAWREIDAQISAEVRDALTEVRSC